LRLLLQGTLLPPLLTNRHELELAIPGPDVFEDTSRSLTWTVKFMLAYLFGADRYIE